MHRYLIALGSNVPHPRHGRPEAVLRAALSALSHPPLRLGPVSATMTSAPVGPSQRRYANAAAVLCAPWPPEAMLAHLKALERSFGRRSFGQRWRARVLDLDIVLWSGGRHASRDLTIPHPRFRERLFVLRPAVRIARDWRDPISGLMLAHLTARLTRPRAAPTAHPTRTRRRLGGP